MYGNFEEIDLNLVNTSYNTKCSEVKKIVILQVDNANRQ